jgi:hypothetical protein
MKTFEHVNLVFEAGMQPLVSDLDGIVTTWSELKGPRNRSGIGQRPAFLRRTVEIDDAEFPATDGHSPSGNIGWCGPYHTGD